MRAPQSGQLSDRVAFDRPTQASNGQGGLISGWAERHACWAQITWLRGSETVIAARLAGRQPVVVRVRACPAAAEIRTDWRIRDLRRGLEFAIKSGPVPSADRGWLDFTAESGVPV